MSPLSVTALECRKRSRKQRRLPDVDLLTKRHNLGRFEQQADRIDTEITALHASQHRRRSHLAAHQADQTEIDGIGDVLRERVRQNTVRAVAEPPSYITKTIGGRPTNPTKDRVWVSAVVAIEKYRIEHDITDQRTPIGPEPSNYRDALTWQQVNETIDDARNLISPPSKATQLPPPTIKRPSLDIGM